MMKSVWLMTALVAAGAAIFAGGVKSEMVEYRSGTEMVSGYLALPAGGGKHPAIVVIHEWWGLNDWVKAQAEKLAGEGYVALAVDLYRGKVATEPEAAHELYRGLPQDRGVRDLKAAFDYLAGRADVEAGRIGSVGWCMGGGYSLLLAEKEPRLAACVVNYGALPTDAEAIRGIQAPVLGNFGAMDQGITPEDVGAFEKAMKAAGKKIDVKIYEGAGHAFENPNNKGGYRAEAAADAWERTKTFFARYLKGTAEERSRGE